MSDLVIGIDPDTKSTAVAVATKHKLLAVVVIKPSKQHEDDTPAVAMARALWQQLPNVFKLYGTVSAVVVEGQQIRHDASAPPADTSRASSRSSGCAGSTRGWAWRFTPCRSCGRPPRSSPS